MLQRINIKHEFHARVIYSTVLFSNALPGHRTFHRHELML